MEEKGEASTFTLAPIIQECVNGLSGKAKDKGEERLKNYTLLFSFYMSACTTILYIYIYIYIYIYLQ